MQVDELSLSDFLCDAGLLSRRDIDRARGLSAENGQPLAETLVTGGMLHDDEVRRATAAVLGVPFVILEKGTFLPETITLLPESFSRAKSAVVFSQSEKGIEVALLSLDDFDAVRSQLGLGRKILPRLTTIESITHALLYYQKHLRETFGALLSKEITQMQVSHMAEDTPTRADAAVRAADALLRHALHQRATEIYMEPSGGLLRVRYRTGDELHDAMTLPLFALPLFSSRFKSLALLPLRATTPSIGRFKISLDSTSNVSITVSTTPVVHDGGRTEKITLGLTEEGVSKTGLSLSSLGCSETNKQHLRRMLTRHEGLVLVCGTQGAGKTTLLYTLLDELTGPSRRIATIEEQISASLQGVSQSEINTELGLNATACLRAELRHDPDVIALDCSTYDEEVATLAANAANRGIFVLMCVEAPSAAEGIERMASLVSPELMCSVLTASIGVRAIPKLCAESKAAYKLSRTEQNMLEETTDIKRVLEELKAEYILGAHAPWKDISLYAAAPCALCDQGYAGIVGLQEVLPITRTMRDALRAGADAETLQTQAKNEGMCSFAEDVLYKAVQGLASVEELRELAAG